LSLTLCSCDTEYGFRHSNFSFESRFIVGLVFDVELIDDLRSASRGSRELIDLCFLLRIINWTAKRNLPIGGDDFDVLGSGRKLAVFHQRTTYGLCNFQIRRTV